jgi:predicted nucleic acid-binding protein
VGGRTFVDTNVLLYLFDAGEPDKAVVAREALAALDPAEVVLSTQVLEEFYWNATRKIRPPMPPVDAAAQVLSLSEHAVVVPDVSVVLGAISRSQEDGVAFWDALVVESALSAGCERILTEDLQHGRRFGPLRVENPFRP